MNDSHVSFTLPANKLQQLWILASQKDVPLAKVIREAIDNYLPKTEAIVEPIVEEVPATNVISLPSKKKAIKKVAKKALTLKKAAKKKK